MHDLLKAFIVLFAVIDPIGTIPIFLGATSKFDAATKRNIAFRAISIAAGILLFFIVIGQVLIEAMEISLPAFQVSGGIILFLFAMSMIFGKGHGATSESDVQDHQYVSVFPLAIPSIASPGAILAVVLLTDNHTVNIGHQAVITLIVMVILGITLLLLLTAGKIQERIGHTGITVITKIMGLLLAAVAMESMLGGIKSYFQAQ